MNLNTEKKYFFESELLEEKIFKINEYYSLYPHDSRPLKSAYRDSNKYNKSIKNFVKSLSCAGFDVESILGYLHEGIKKSVLEFECESYNA